MMLSNLDWNRCRSMDWRMNSDLVITLKLQSMDLWNLGKVNGNKLRWNIINQMKSKIIITGFFRLGIIELLYIFFCCTPTIQHSNIDKWLIYRLTVIDDRVIRSICVCVCVCVCAWEKNQIWRIETRINGFPGLICLRKKKTQNGKWKISIINNIPILIYYKIK